jgi:hypothetical protein
MNSKENFDVLVQPDKMKYRMPTVMMEGSTYSSGQDRSNVV